MSLDCKFVLHILKKYRNFSIRLENQHVIGANQISIIATQTGPSGVALNSTFQNREKEEYQIEVGNVLLNLARIVPDGLLVFFPSYTVMERCLSKWSTLQKGQSKTIYDSISKYKKIFVEPKDNKSLQDCIAAYEDILANGPPASKGSGDIQPSNGATFFAVCRGRVSEGLDFADRNGRAVVIIGLPFPPKENMKVKMKREYLDNLAEKAPPHSKVRHWFTYLIL
jgi:regulator of telomere elongation helicase 1